MVKTLGTLKTISIRNIWPKEACDFTPWLAQPENMNRLGEKLGISFGPAYIEEPVGSYRADIFTTENSIERQNVIIENQFDTTDHDHLGKIITYASGKNANIIIWIAETARDEHRSAVQWLNEHTDDDISVFLITVKLVQIDDSKPAPIFEIIESPNGWHRAIKNKNTLTNLHKERLDFWERFIDYASRDNNFFHTFRKRKASTKPYYDLPFDDDKRYYFYLSNTIQNGAKEYGISAYMVHQKPLYARLKANAVHIEREIGAQLIWEEFNAICTIKWIAPDSVPESDDAIFDWYITAAYKFKDVLAKYAN